MLTTDFSGTYDYEKTEAEHAAKHLLEDLRDGYYTIEQFHEACRKERAHWAKYLDAPGSLDDFLKYFDAAIEQGLTP